MDELTFLCYVITILPFYYAVYNVGLWIKTKYDIYENIALGIINDRDNVKEIIKITDNRYEIANLVTDIYTRIYKK